MKYKFVYDKGFEKNLFLNLSQEEIGVVIATVLGKHNAMFFGYKPERLILAIKKLCYECNYIEVNESNQLADDISFFACNFTDKVQKGVVFVPNINNKSGLFYDTIRLASSNINRDCQIVVYDTNAPRTDRPYFNEALENFDIIYECKEGDIIQKSVDELRSKFKSIQDYKLSLCSGKHVTGKFREVDSYWTTGKCFDTYCELKRRNSVLALKYMKVARSISDINFHNLTPVSDLEGAMKLYYKGDVE